MSFPAATFDFLSGIAAHNEMSWFEANRTLYESGYVEPAKAFVTELGPRLMEIAPDIRYEPRINGSIARVNRDVRFSKDKRPYKDHLDVWFWLGDTKGWDRPGFWFSINAEKVMGGVGIYQFQGAMLDSFRQSVIHPRSGRALAALLADLAGKGYEVGGRTRKRPPRGFEIDPERADLLLYEGLYAGFEMPAAAAREPDFVARLLPLYRDTWPIGQWLADEVID